eukprot:TRINITY_DN19321_c0_g1_i1.p1 TRINITY_DN19321_c0_g1~~TRINITY_DN19321_c0_g1_i1.p1  ORF type:complete len:929 (+),score=155.94 TRINITY_DN19321_c0_g1_i1:32-2788(+)
MGNENLEVGTKVIYRGQEAVVMYTGPLHHAVGNWVGVQFEESAVGRNDGSTGGKKYFDGKHGSCLFVRPGNLVAVNSKKHRSAFNQWQVFDAANEGEFLRHHEIAHSTESMIRKESKQLFSAKTRTPIPEPLASDQGPHFANLKEGKISEEEINMMITHYKSGNGANLHPYYLHRMLTEATKIVTKQCPTAVSKISISQGSNLVVCGDTHGQLEDLLWIYFKHGTPSADNQYLMNGDIADRGNQAVEIFSILLAYKILCPASVWINKGNHEDNLMNLRYGFHGELKAKYPAQYQILFNAFQKFFYAIPLATVINKQVFVVHGGLTRKQLRLGLLDSVDHRRPVPDSPKTSLHDMIFYDMLWSDPQSVNGVGLNSRGGDTISFGPDVTHKFLALNGLSMMIRSHQVPETVDSAGFPRGFQWHHPFPADSKVKGLNANQPGMCVTVFSASNYVGTNANMGGVVIFKNGVADFEILEHYAQDVAYLHEVEKETEDATEMLRSIAKHEKTSREAMLAKAAGLLESQGMEELKSMIVRKKQELFEFFWAIDQDKDLHLKPELWKEGCSYVLSDGLPWDDIMQKLCLTDPTSGLIRYTSFLQRFQIRFKNKMGLHAGFRRAITDRCYEMLLMADLSMRETFAVLDRNDDGLVSLREFQEVLSSLGTGLTKPQLQALMKTIVVHSCHPGSGGKLKIEDFLARLQLKYSSTHAKIANHEQDWVPMFLGQVAKDIVQAVQKEHTRTEEMVLQSTSPIAYLTEFFNSHDLDKNGYLEQTEFLTALKRLPCCVDLEPEKLKCLGDYCDVVGNGRVNYLEFLHAFHVEDSAGSELSEDILEHVYRILHFEFTGAMRRAFHSFEEPDDLVTSEQFKSVVMTINNLSDPPPLSETQIQCLIDTLDLNGEGKLDYEDFLSSFEIIDVVLDEEG